MDSSDISRRGLTYRQLRRKRIRRIRKIVGVGMIVVGLFVVGTVPYFYLNSSMEGNKLLLQFHAVSSPSGHHIPSTTDVKAGDLLGEISIPKLRLIVPVLQGTGESELAVGAGHLIPTVLPGKIGTSILAAHNVTWFNRINELRPGDTIAVRTTYGSFNYRVTGSEVVPNGGFVPDSPDPSIALEACYPLNALYLTKRRYFVFAQQIGTQTTRQKQPLILNTPARSYQVDIPVELKHEGTTLKSNSLPMGNLSYSGTPSKAFRQSNKPLDASSALVQLYLAWIHSNADRNLTWMKLIGGQGAPTTFYGISLSRYHYDSPFDVKLYVVGNELKALQATTNVTIRHTFHITITASNHQGDIKIDSISVEQY